MTKEIIDKGLLWAYTQLVLVSSLLFTPTTVFSLISIATLL